MCTEKWNIYYRSNILFLQIFQFLKIIVINRRKLTCQNYYAVHKNTFHYKYHYTQVKIQQPTPILIRLIKHTPHLIVVVGFECS
jgi:hypothetical protein